MSSFGRISKRLLKNKFRIISFILGFHVLALLVIQIWNAFSKTSENLSFTGFTSIAMLIGVIFLTVMNEQTYVNDKYRLVPISDNKLYSSSVLTSLISLIYLMVGEFVIYIAAVKIFPNDYDEFLVRSFNSVQQYFFKFELLVAFVLAIIVLWTGITALHLLVNWANDSLPFTGQTAAKVIVAIVIVWAFSVPFNFITGNVLRLVGFNELNNSFGAVTRVMNSSILMMVAWIAVFTAINLYLLNKKTETVN